MSRSEGKSRIRRGEPRELEMSGGEGGKRIQGWTCSRMSEGVPQSESKCTRAQDLLRMSEGEGFESDPRK